MREFDSVNPATEELLQTHISTTLEECDRFVIEAAEAQKDWRKSSLSDRKVIFLRLLELITENQGRLALLISQENGKPLWESQNEVKGVIGKIQLSIEALEERCAEKTFSHQSKSFHLSYKPLGVLLVLGPFNFPAHLPMGQIIPALLSGNAVVFKPSEFTTMVGEYLVKLLLQAGLPSALISLVKGRGDIGAYLCKHPMVKGVLFTGGYQTGRNISMSMAEFPEKLLALEMGGNNALVISSYRDQKHVLDMMRQSAYLTSGQRCTCARRIIVVKNSYTESLISDFVHHLRSVTVGPYTQDPEPFMGPVINRQAYEFIQEYYQGIVKRKADVLVPLIRHEGPGYFLSPALLDVSSCYQELEDEECFGPLSLVIQVDSLDEAISVANATDYGLSASLISTEKSEFERFYESVNAGIINWNQPTNGASSKLPFGGVGKSGNFRPAGYFSVDSCVYPVASVTDTDL